MYSFIYILMQTDELRPFVNLVKEKFSEFQVSLEVSCFADEVALQSSISTNPVRVALDFADIKTLSGSPEEEVEYSLLISGDDMVLTNWVDFQNTYHQVPNTVPETFLQLFTPLQRFFNNFVVFKGVKINRRTHMLCKS